MFYFLVLCLVVVLRGWASAQSSSSSVSVSTPGYAPFTYSSSTGNAQAVATASSPASPYYYQYPYHTQKLRQARQLPRNDATQQIIQKRLPPGLQRAPTPLYSAPAPSYSAPAGISQSIAPVFFGRDGRRTIDTSHMTYFLPAQTARGFTPSHVQVTPVNHEPFVIYTSTSGLPQAAISFAPPPPSFSSQHAGNYAGAHVISAAPPAPAENFPPPAEELGSISSALSQAATAFAPPSPPSGFSGAEGQTAPVAHLPSLTSIEESGNILGHSEAGGQAQAGESAPPPSPPTPAYGPPTEEGGNFAGAQAQAGENSPPPSPQTPAYGPPTEEGGNFAGAQAQAGENAPPPAPPTHAYGPPTEEAGNFAGAQAQAGAAAPHLPPSSNYGLPTTNSEGGDSSVLTIRIPHSEYGLPEIRMANPFKVDPIEVSADDVEKSYVFVPAFPEGKSPLPEGAALSPPAPGEFNPPDGALLSPPTPIVNSQPLPAPRNPFRRAMKH